MTRTLGILLAAVVVPAWCAWACPFCTSVSQTLTEEFAAMDVVVIAQLEKLPPMPADGKSPGSRALRPAATFRVVEVLKGQSVIDVQAEFTTTIAGTGQPGDKYLVTGIGPPDFTWSTPVKLNDRQHQYLLDLVRLPSDAVARLAFFQQYLQDADEMLSQDAYDEFARAPYATVKELKPKLDHAQLVSWIQDPKITASRKRLYYTLLGVCGSQQDLPLLTALLRDADARATGLDAAIACYLTLSGAEGMPLVEELFLRRRGDKPNDPFADVYAAVMALRFHGTEGGTIPRQRVVEALTLVLDNPHMADLVVSDLARWEDWSQLDRLVALFKAADPATSNIRLQIVNYVRVCPLPAAQEALEEFKRIDPGVVRRAMTFFPAKPKPAKK